MKPLRAFVSVSAVYAVKSGTQLTVKANIIPWTLHSLPFTSYFLNPWNRGVRLIQSAVVIVRYLCVINIFKGQKKPVATASLHQTKNLHKPCLSAIIAVPAPLWISSHHQLPMERL